MFRQPYRITMAEWDFTVNQKRVLSGIIFCLQKEMSLVERGIPIDQIPVFQQTGRWVDVDVPLKLLLPNGGNQHMVHRAIEGLGKDCIILLPEIKGRKGTPLPETRLSLHIQKLSGKRMARTLRLRMGRDLALELVRTSSGLTSLCWETLTAIRSPHALRLYEIASHWKDHETMAMSLEQFRRWMRLCDRFKENKELMRSVVRPAEKLLKKVSEVHVHCQPVKSGRRIVKMNLHIQHRRRREEEEIYHMRLREQIVNILRIRFRFKEEHFRSIEGVLRDNGKLRALNEKVGMLWGLLDDPSNQVRDETAWAVASIQSAFTM